MPTIKIELTEDQLAQYRQHVSKGFDLELQEETSHGVTIEIGMVAGITWMVVDSQAGKLDLGEVDIDFSK